MALKEIHEFSSRDELIRTLEERSRHLIYQKLKSEDKVNIAFSGGSTPKNFLQMAAENWTSFFPRLQIALVDERFVPLQDERSNERMITAALKLREQPPASFLSLADHGQSIEQTVRQADEIIKTQINRTFDLVYLGMGLDGHTASWFPGGDNLALATRENCDVFFVSMKAPNAPEPRITMTMPIVADAENVILHIEGNEKRQVLEEALSDGPAQDMPIRYLLRHPTAQLQIYWAP